MRGRTVAGVALVASLALTAFVVIGVVALRPGGSGGSPDAGSPPSSDSAEPTTLASYDTREVRVVRAPFCDRVSPTGIEHALGDVPASHDTWEDGDRVRLSDGGRDRVQEHGCSWTAADGSLAAAWVFATPVDRRTARSLVRSAPADDCDRYDGDRLGRPSVAWACPTEGGTEQRHAGRLGDAWFTCSVTTGGTRDTATDRRASEWCATVLEAARG